ncbi:MAG: hydrogenobyrinic acid a,c-diamide synthase (glutamine-hydrolyzing) [Candidatus Verstraetearchaeota archaeon]|nr:hydrogenobyrinic acid a,c-diamide synthase (glutamine-hydrolyzing) [Candidatus Verstraetearchaeota archaeon]
MLVNPPRVMIASPTSSEGKTVVTSAIIYLLRRRGLSVQAYKVGPDFIDPQWLSLASGKPCRNIDSWLMEDKGLKNYFARTSFSSDISVVEGVMGLFDSPEVLDEHGSSAHVAKLLSCPVVLLLDVRNTSKSAAAVVLGSKHFDKELNIKGVILNFVRSSRHCQKVKRAIEHYAGLPVLGDIPECEEFTFPYRHLGLLTVKDAGREAEELLQHFSKVVEEHIDLDKILEIAQQAPPLAVEVSASSHPRQLSTKSSAKVYVAYDPAFNFYYADTLEHLRNTGLQVEFFSPINDRELPSDANGIILGGGYPELYAEQLEKNNSMRRSLAQAAEDQCPIYAECGGLMYLSTKMHDLNRRLYDMVGLIPASCHMARKHTLNLVKVEVLDNVVIAHQGALLKGHEFHYSRLVLESSDVKFCYKVLRGEGIDGSRDGIVVYNTLASYFHLFTPSHPEALCHFADYCRSYARR